MVRAVIFDLDNTLYDYDAINDTAVRNAGMWLCGQTGISYEAFGRAFDEGRRRIKESMQDCASRHNRMLYFQKTSELLGLNPIRYSLELYEAYWGYMLDHMTLVPDAGKVIKRLHAEGIRTAVCTDLTAHIQHRKLRRLGIADYVDVLVTSEEAGVEKPDAVIFDMVLGKLAVAPDEALYVGDSFEKDVIGAGNAGLRPVWFNPRKKTAEGVENKDIENKDIKSRDFAEITQMKQLERYVYGAG